MNAKKKAGNSDCCSLAYVKTIIGRDFSKTVDCVSVRASYDLQFNSCENYPLLHFPGGIDGTDITISPQYAVSLFLWKSIIQYLSDKEKSLDDLEVVFTIPARYTASQIHAYKEAAELLGIKILGFIPEPSAAAIGYASKGYTRFKRIVVYDMGGGTFDVTLLERDEDGKFRVLNTGGHHAIGGTRFDFLLLDLIADKYSKVLSFILSM